MDLDDPKKTRLKAFVNQKNLSDPTKIRKLKERRKKKERKKKEEEEYPPWSKHSLNKDLTKIFNKTEKVIGCISDVWEGEDIVCRSSMGQTKSDILC